MKKISIGIMNDLFGAMDLNCCGGLQRVALYELEGLLKKNFDVLLYTGQLIGKHDKIRNLYFPWYSLSGKNKLCSHVNDILEYLYAALNSMLFYYLNNNRDILLFMDSTPVGLIKPKKSLVHLQVPPDLYFNKFYKSFRIFKTRFMDAHYLFCSKAMLEEYAKEYPWIREKGFVLYNGVDTEKFKPMQKSPSQRVKFFFASHWSEDKGIFVLLKAAEILEKKRKDFEVILGGSPYVWYRCDIPQEQKEIYLRVEGFVESQQQ